MTRWAAALAAGLLACGPPRRPMEAGGFVPSGAVAIAGARLDALRASPLAERLPRAWLDPFGGASRLWAVWNGSDLLLIARGHFREAAPGAKLVGSEWMLSGSQAMIDAAVARERAGSPGSADLLAREEAAAEGHVVWIAARGRANLPLTGDLANLNRFLRLADFATLGLRLDASAGLDFTAQSPTPETAQNLEESLRAFLSLSVLGVKRQPELAAMLRAAEVRREDRDVHATLNAPADTLPKLFDYFSR